MKKNTPEYLYRTLLRCPYNYALILSEEAYMAEMKRLKMPRDQWGEFVKKGFGATCNIFHCQDGEKIALVCMGDTKGFTREEIYGLLTHEAVHIWQYVKEDINETRPGMEQEAYAIQAIAQSLMTSYRDQKQAKQKK
jgi:hypothetical protein